MVVESVISKLGESTLTVEERAIFANIWKSATRFEKLELASRICKVSSSTESVAESFIRVTFLVDKLNRMYS